MADLKMDNELHAFEQEGPLFNHAYLLRPDVPAALDIHGKETAARKIFLQPRGCRAETCEREDMLTC